MECKHDWAGVMILGMQYAQECRKCEAVLLHKEAAQTLLGALSDFVKIAQEAKDKMG